MSDIPLHQHALLSDCGSAALVTARGSVDWLCVPRFDSAPVFARLLDDDAGHFVIAPTASDCLAVWSYRPSSLVLDTTWSCPEGELVVTDAMALGARERGHELGRSAPGVLLRRVRCTQGDVSVSVEYVPHRSSDSSTHACSSQTARSSPTVAPPFSCSARMRTSR